jgi:hypothetical protein
MTDDTGALFTSDDVAKAKINKAQPLEINKLPPLETDKSMRDKVAEKLADDSKRALPRDVEKASSLYGAIHAIYGEVARLEKTDTNKHGGYKYANVDSFRDMMRELFHKHGLIDRINEVYSSAVSEGLKSGTCKFQYEWWMIHVETGQSTTPISRSVLLPYVGSQTSGIASSFAWKEIVRNEFNISTGEPDPSRQMDEADQRAGEKLTAPESEEAAGNLSDGLEVLIKSKPDRAKLEAWKDEAQPVLSQLQNQHYVKLKAVYTKAWKAAE